MIKKSNKIYVVLSSDQQEREVLLSKLACRLGFAAIPSDARKIIRKDIYSIDLQSAYFVLCSNYSFRGATNTNQKLFEMAARGICIAVACKALPSEYEFLTEVVYRDDLG